MKIEFFKKLLDMLKKNESGLKNDQEKFPGYNTRSGDLLARDGRITEEILEDVPADGYTSLSGNGIEVITKEKAVFEVYNYIQTFLRENVKVVPRCNVTENEWRTFLEIAYDQFLLNGLQAGYSSLMQIGIKYTFYQQYLYDVSQVTFQDVLESFDISMLPFGVANGMVENIRKLTYLRLKKDSVIDIQEYRKVAQK